MNDSKTLDLLFQRAVAAIDAGDVSELERLVVVEPRLVRERLDSPGAWLCDKVEDALDGFFQRPYLLWFVAEDPVRNGRLPGNIADVTRVIIRAADRERVETLRDQLDYALKLVSWSWIARDCNVQVELIDVLADAGAALDGNPENALVNGNVAAAEHLVARGAPLSLATALCLGRWDDVQRIGPTASAAAKQFGLVLAALRGNSPSADLYSHATALHHAVYSGSLDAVKVLVEAGASLDTKDAIYEGTPLGWAEYGRQIEIAEFLREKGAR
jgi:hypothetical protein